MLLNKSLKSCLRLSSILGSSSFVRAYTRKIGLPFKIGWVEAHKIFAEDRSFFAETQIPRQNDSNLPTFYDKQNKIEQHYLPFHGVKVQGLITSYYGSYGIDHYYTDWIWNGKELTPVTRCVTHWHSVSGTAPFVDYELGSAITQVFAGFNLPRLYVEKVMKNTISRPNDLRELVPEANGSEIIYTPFEMKSNFALRKVTERLLDAELNRVSNFVRQSWHADHVDITVNMNLDKAISFRMHSYYLPAYIHQKAKSNGTEVSNGTEASNTVGTSTVAHHNYKILNGCTKDLSGPKIFSPFKVGGLAGSIIGIGMIGLLSPLGPAGSGLGLGLTQVLARGTIGFLTVSSLTGVFTKASNSYKLWRDARQIEKDMKENEKFESQKYDADLFEDRTPQKDGPKGTKDAVKHETGAKYLASNLCHILKLDHRKPITEKQLKAAYHGQVRKWHPDTFKQKEAKDTASLEMADLMTKEINHAYALLLRQFNEKN